MADNRPCERGRVVLAPSRTISHASVVECLKHFFVITNARLNERVAFCHF